VLGGSNRDDRIASYTFSFILFLASYVLAPRADRTQPNPGRDQPANSTLPRHYPRPSPPPRSPTRAPDKTRIAQPVTRSHMTAVAHTEPTCMSAPVQSQRADHRAHATAADPPSGPCHSTPPPVKHPKTLSPAKQSTQTCCGSPRRASTTKANARTHAGAPPGAVHGDTIRRAGSLSVTARPLSRKSNKDLLQDLRSDCTETGPGQEAAVKCMGGAPSRRQHTETDKWHPRRQSQCLRAPHTQEKRQGTEYFAPADRSRAFPPSPLLAVTQQSGYSRGSRGGGRATEQAARKWQDGSTMRDRPAIGGTTFIFRRS